MNAHLQGPTSSRLPLTRFFLAVLGQIQIEKASAIGQGLVFTCLQNTMRLWRCRNNNEKQKLSCFHSIEAILFSPCSYIFLGKIYETVL